MAHVHVQAQTNTLAGSTSSNGRTLRCVKSNRRPGEGSALQLIQAYSVTWARRSTGLAVQHNKVIWVTVENTRNERRKRMTLAPKSTLSSNPKQQCTLRASCLGFHNPIFKILHVFKAILNFQATFQMYHFDKVNNFF